MLDFGGKILLYLSFSRLTVIHGVDKMLNLNAFLYVGYFEITPKRTVIEQPLLYYIHPEYNFLLNKEFQ